jgi:hypothetical protein
VNQSKQASQARRDAAAANERGVAPSLRENELDKEGEREGASGSTRDPPPPLFRSVGCRVIIIVVFETNWNGFVAPRDCGTGSAPGEFHGNEKEPNGSRSTLISNGPSRRQQSYYVRSRLAIVLNAFHAPTARNADTLRAATHAHGSTHDGSIEESLAALVSILRRTDRVTDVVPSVVGIIVVV